MSRAFVKDGDGDDDGNDLPDLPLSPHPNYVTPRGLALLQARLDDAQRRLAELDPAAVESRLARAHVAREIRWLNARIGAAIPVSSENKAHDRISFGARVHLVDEDGREYHYRIVGEDEADPEHGRVSWVSPLARALDRARVGDSVVWRRPAGDLTVEVLSVDFDDEPA
jgi:transcription elongation GreA/GreB family factor